MVALLMVLFIMVLLTIDIIISKGAMFKETNECLTEKERLVADNSIELGLGITMADGGELIENNEEKK